MRIGKAVNWIALGVWLFALLSSGVSAPGRTIAGGLIPIASPALALAVMYADKGPWFTWLAFTVNAIYMLMLFAVFVVILLGVLGVPLFSAGRQAIWIGLAVAVLMLPGGISVPVLWQKATSARRSNPPKSADSGERAP
jgi:hypothetical protein